MSASRIPENARASDQSARASSKCERIVEAVEEELARLREKRPGLASRVDRASHLLVVHLSDPGSRTIRAKIDAKRRCRFLVRSLTSGGIYVVDPGEAGWTCSCPDYRRRNAPCKHLVAAWCLRAADRRAQRKGCSACDRGWVFLPTEIVDPKSGEIAQTFNPVRCTRCGGGLSREFVQQWLESQSWIFAKSRADNPHWYCLRRNADDEATFERIVEFIREHGVPYLWWGRHYLQYVAGEWAYWTMGSPIPQTVLINRKSLEQVRLDQLRNRGGAGVQWGWLHSDIEAEREELRRQEAGQEELGEE
jgi:SWIM zinc finger